MKRSQFEQLIREVIRETIRKVDGKYVVYPEKGGKRLGTHSTKKAAEKQLTAIHLNKEAYEKGKVIIYHNFQGVDADENIAGTNKVLNVADCIGNEPGKDYKYFTTEKKKYVEDMVKNAAGEGWKKFPPVLAIPHPVVSGKYSIIDGNHRLGAFTIGKIPQINAKILSDDKILLAERGAEWDENKLPKTIPLADAKKKGVNLKEYFATQPLHETVDTDNMLTVLSVIDGKRNLDNDQISQLFSDDVAGTFYIYTNEEGEYENLKPISRQEAYKYIDYYNARLKKDHEREEKLGAELGVLGIESELQFNRGEFKTDPSVFSANENYADGKVKGKSRPGRVKKAGASCKGSVSSLRAKAKKYGGEKGKMYHWCANMKGGKK